MKVTFGEDWARPNVGWCGLSFDGWARCFALPVRLFNDSLSVGSPGKRAGSLCVILNRLSFVDKEGCVDGEESRVPFDGPLRPCRCSATTPSKSGDHAFKKRGMPRSLA